MFPWVTVILIAINVLVFLFQITLSDKPTELVDLGPWKQHQVTFANYERLTRYDQVQISPARKFIFTYGVVPGEIARGKDFPPDIGLPIYVTLITSTFLHGGLLHLGGNMLFLWIFGDNIEEAMGRVRFVIFYFLCAGAGAMLQVAGELSSGTPMIGASGAIAGILAAYFLLYPGSRILTLVPIFFFFTFIEIPALIMLGFWFLLQLLRTPAGTAGGVAVLAHVGGFLAGIMLTPYFKRKEIPLELANYFRRYRG